MGLSLFSSGTNPNRDAAAGNCSAVTLLPARPRAPPLPPTMKEGDAERQIPVGSLAILLGLQSRHRSQAIIILGFSDDENCHCCVRGLTGLWGHFLKT